MKNFGFILLTIFLILGRKTMLYAQTGLPVGSNPPALTYDYFPDKAYAVVWRNWNLVPVERIAKTLDCDTHTIQSMAYSMGLGPSISIPESYKNSMFITILRRNWHLLPYNQLITLLDISELGLEDALRENDFLFIKLGNLKPYCEEVKYEAIDGKSREKLEYIKNIVDKHFGELSKNGVEDRYAFLKDFEALPKASNRILDEDADKNLRFIYSYFGIFGDPLLNIDSNPYPDGLLRKYADFGINGVWLPVVLSKISPATKDFPGFGRDYGKRIENLRKIAKSAKKYGIKIFLYLNEPRPQSLNFFKEREDVLGVKENGMGSMCTSNEKVKDWLINSLSFVFEEIPDLGGVFTISASENLTNCASHGKWEECIRCRKKEYDEIISEINSYIFEGVKKGNPDARVIAWDWGWKDNFIPQIAKNLPKGIELMSVSEWGKAIERGGISSHINEYAISAVGPGPRADRSWGLAKNNGLNRVAKVQFNNTWELSAVPWLPVLNLVAEHAKNISNRGIKDMMLSWSLGGFPSPNLEVARIFADNPQKDTKLVLQSIAEERYGERAVSAAIESWTLFSEAFVEFPYDRRTLYFGPQQLGPANLLYTEPTGYKATMVGFPYDDINSWKGEYPLLVFRDQFRKLSEIWRKGVDSFEKVVKYSDRKNRQNAIQDLQISKAVFLHFASVGNQIDFIENRERLLDKKISQEGKRDIVRQQNKVLDNEIDLAIILYHLTMSNSSIGFEASNQYYYVPQDLMEKVMNCEYVKEMMNKTIKDS